MTTESWWRVVFGIGGELRSCKAVEACSRESDNAEVFYVEASNKVVAEGLALKAYRERQRQRARQIARRQAYKAAGKCICGDPLTGDKHRCPKCITSSRAASDRYEARKRGETVEPLPPKSVAIAQTVALRATNNRLETLLAVREAWQSAGNVNVFSKWLNAEIAKLEREVAA